MVKKRLLRMSKRVILVTGTPCVGKTTVAKTLTEKLKAEYINLTELAEKEHLTEGMDKERGSLIIDENRMKRKITKIITEARGDVIIDGHYAVSVVTERLVTYVFVLRRDPIELRRFMQNCGYPERKMKENLSAEILDVCLFDALNTDKTGKVCELDVTGKTRNQVVDEVTEILNGRGVCCVGIVDWLGKLENEGLLDEFMK